MGALRARWTFIPARVHNLCVFNFVDAAPAHFLCGVFVPKFFRKGSTKRRSFSAFAETPNTGSATTSAVSARPVTWTSFPSFAGSTRSDATDTTSWLPSFNVLYRWTERPSFQNRSGKDTTNRMRPIRMPLKALPMRLNQEVVELASAIAAHPQEVVVVTNEVGWGLVSEYPAGRVFADQLGRLNQAIAAACDQVVLLVAGRPLHL